MKRTLLPILLLLLTACQRPIEERIATEVKDWTATNCPQHIDDITQCDSMTYDPLTHTVAYHYSVSGEADSPLFWTTYDLNRQAIKENMLHNLHSNLEVRELIAQKCNFEFVYRSATTQERYYTLRIPASDL